MSWIQSLARKVFASHQHLMSSEQAQRWMNINRMIYFISASFLTYTLYEQNKKAEEIESPELISGKPVIQDHSEAHRRLREMNVEHGTITKFSFDKGFETVDYHKDYYYQQLELEALERAREAQQKAIKEGKELPSDAIKLVGDNN